MILCLQSEERCKNCAESFLAGGMFWGTGIAYQMLSKLWLMVGNHLCNTLSFLEPHSPKWSSQVKCSDVHVKVLASLLIPSNTLTEHTWLQMSGWSYFNGGFSSDSVTPAGTGIHCENQPGPRSITHHQSLDTTISKGWTGHPALTPVRNTSKSSLSSN